MAERLCLGCMEKINDKYIECPYCGYIDGIPAKEAYHMEPGSVLSGRYIVGRVVGYGGFGVTYIGYDGLLEKKIAIKEYLPSEFATRMPGQTEVTVYSGERQEQFYSGIDKFVEEAKRLAQFKEVPGVVRIFDSFTENKTAYIIMEYLEGETLKSRLKREGRLSEEESLRIIMPILTALKEVHKIGIIHRDIAPDNIFLTDKGEVKLLDFGAARYATTTHSKSLSVIIKQGYAPEEQYRSRGDQGPWTDVYACGATLYKMLTGVTPEDSMERAGKDTLQPPSKQGVKLSRNLDTAVMNAMNIRIEDRTQSAEEFEAELISEREIKRKKNHERKMDIGKWPLWVKLVSGMAACGILTFGVLLATNVIHFDMKQIVDTGVLASNQVYVPNLVNYGVEEAETKTLDSSLILQITDKQNSDVIPKDKILSQNLMDGTVVEAGTALEVVVSAGGEIVYIEELTGLTQEEAVTSLEAMGLLVEVIEEESEIAPGCVIRYEVGNHDGAEMNISAGIEKGSTVKLYVSKGRSDIDENADTEVPQVAGLTYADAMSLASNAKLYIYRMRSEYSTTVPKGQVMEQNPAAGSVVKQGSSLGVVVSLGIQTTRVPDVQYKDINTAAGLLSQNNLTYEYQYEESNTVAKNRVIRQSIAAGTEVEMQTRVVLYISKGNPNAGGGSIVVADNEGGNGSTQVNEGSTSVNTSSASTENTSFMSTESTTTEEPPMPVPDAPDKGKIKVPNLVGMTQEAATRTINSSNLSLGTITRRSREGTADGTILWQGIEAGSKVAKNSVVSIIVCDNSVKTQYRYRTREKKIVTETVTETLNQSSRGREWTLVNSKEKKIYGEATGWRVGERYTETDSILPVEKPGTYYQYWGLICNRCGYHSPCAHTMEKHLACGGNAPAHYVETFSVVYVPPYENNKWQCTICDFGEWNTFGQSYYVNDGYYCLCKELSGTIFGYKPLVSIQYENTYSKRIYGSYSSYSEWADTISVTASDTISIETRQVYIYPSY